ncbi:MAG: hypothetical protein HY465_01475, partial [Deltaproteobacteria bacterium]|nr:hypothetical protein [Deltaproteobacteria bacterium]
CCNTCPASATHLRSSSYGGQAATGGFENSAAWKKLDLRFQDAWKDAQKRGKRKQSFECMIKLSGVPLPREKEALGNAGFKARTFIKRIVTGSVTARDVQVVAELPFVEVMELAVPVTGK